MRVPEFRRPDDMRAAPASADDGAYTNAARDESERDSQAPRTHPDRAMNTDPLQRLVEALVADLQADGAAIAMWGQDGIVCAASAGVAPPIGSRPQASSGLTRWCFETGRVVLCRDAATDFRINPSIARSLRLGSALAVPIGIEPRTVGVVEVFSSRRSAFDDRSVAFVQVAAHAAAEVLAERNLYRDTTKAEGLPPSRSADSRRVAVAAAFAMALVVFGLAVVTLNRGRENTSERANVSRPPAVGTLVPPERAEPAPPVRAPRSQPEAPKASNTASNRATDSAVDAGSNGQEVGTTTMMTLQLPVARPPQHSDIAPPVDPVSVSPKALPVIAATATAVLPAPLFVAPSEFVPNRTLRAHSNWVTGVAFSADGQRLASASWDRSVKLWDVHTGKELNTLPGRSEGIQALAFSRDGRWIAAENSDNTVTTWDANTGQPGHTFPGRKRFATLSNGWVYSIAFSPDGRWLASGVDSKTVRLWDVHTGQLIRDLAAQHRPVIYIAFSPDGRLLASGDDDKTISIWETATGKKVATLSGHDEKVYAAAFSPDGRLLASASADKTVRLWDVATGRELAALTGHRNWVTSVAFSPDGRRLASGSWDNTVKIWDVASRREQQTLENSDRVYSVAFDSRGRWLASGSEDGRIHLWRLAARERTLTAR